jgi:hypothetical protein
MTPEQYKPQEFLWSQRDIRWGYKQLGKSGLLVKDFGCAGTAINYCVNRAWKTKGVQRFSRPGEFFDYANTHNFFTPNGMIYWNVADSFSAGALRYTTNKREAYITVAQVRWGSLLHWRTLLNGDLCFDPWQGKIIKRAQTYWVATGREIYYKLT